MPERLVHLTVNPQNRTVVAKANFSLGLTRKGRWAPGDVGFHLLNDHCTETGRMFVTRLMGEDAADGWLSMSSDDAYGFTMTWHEMFSQDNMVAVLIGILHMFYGITLQLSMEVVEPEQPAMAPVATIPPGDMDATA